MKEKMFFWIRKRKDRNTEKGIICCLFEPEDQLKSRWFSYSETWCCPPHLSMVAWCMGVLVVPGLTAVNGPVFREFIKLSTGTLVLRGLLSKQNGCDADFSTINQSLNRPILICSSWVGMNSLCVSQLFACLVCVLLCPSIGTHTPPTWARTVHLEDIPSGHETHCMDRVRWGVGRTKKGHLSSFDFVSVLTQNEWHIMVLPGKVVLMERFETQVISSSPPEQSSIPSQAWSMGMNLNERLQKKYLLSINCLTARRKRVRC